MKQEANTHLSPPSGRSAAQSGARYLVMSGRPGPRQPRAGGVGAWERGQGLPSVTRSLLPPRMVPSARLAWYPGCPARARGSRGSQATWRKALKPVSAPEATTTRKEKREKNVGSGLLQVRWQTPVSILLAPKPFAGSACSPRRYRAIRQPNRPQSQPASANGQAPSSEGVGVLLCREQRVRKSRALPQDTGSLVSCPRRTQTCG